MLDDDKTFTRFMWVVLAIVLVALGVGIWAVIELVKWVTTK
jgi:hypothetical protein